MNKPYSAVKNEYLFSVSKEYKDECFLEKKARSLRDGKMYAVRFMKNKKYVFYIYSNNVWKIYFLYQNDVYNYRSFNSVGFFIELEKDIKCHNEKPFAMFKNGKLVFNYSKKHIICPEIPLMPFYFKKDFKMLDYYEMRCRYPYKSPPKYLIVAKIHKHCKIPEENKYCIFGCNDLNMYNKIYYNKRIIVTNSCEKINVIAVEKLVNNYNIIPRQHCVNVI